MTGLPRLGVLWILLAGAAPAAPAQAKPSKAVLDSLQRVVAADSADHRALLALGRALAAVGRQDEAERWFRDAITIAPGSAEAYLALGTLPELRGDHYWKERIKRDGHDAVRGIWLEAAKHTRLAFLLDPLVDPSLLPRAEETVTIRIGGTRYAFWWAFPLAKAINAFRQGKFAEAERKCASLVADDGGDFQLSGLPDAVLWLRALAVAHMDRYDAAAADFTALMARTMHRAQYVRVDPAPLAANDYRYLLAMMSFYSGRDEVAESLFRQALEADLSLFMAHERLAGIYERANRMEEAVAERRRAVEVDPDNSALLTGLGATLLRADQTEAALDAFTRAMTVNPRDAEAAYQAGRLALRLGRADLARHSLERFMAIAPARMAARVDEARELLGGRSR